MSELLPVNVGAAAVAARANHVAGVSATPPPPPAVDQLASWTQENYRLEVKAATQLGFPVSHLRGDYQRSLLIFGSSRWADVDSDDGHVYRFGVSLRVLVEVQTESGHADLTLPVIAANVELSRAQASAQLLIRGYNSPTVGKLLPPWQSFTVDSYSDYMSAVSAIQQEIMDHDENVVPQLLATTIAAPALPSSSASIGTVIGLRAIAGGRSLPQALHDAGEASGPAPDEQVSDAITQTYADLDVGPTEEPGADAQRRAHDQLGALAPRHHWWNTH